MTEETEKALQKFEDGLAPIFAFLIQASGTDTDNNIFERLAQAAKKIQDAGEVTPKQFIDGIAKVEDAVTDFIPGGVDDMLIDSAFNSSRFLWEKKFADKLQHLKDK